jgi:predicted metal-dependent phosphoesterase TrpH
MNQKSKADMHVHSTASELSKLGVQRSLALPECATEPEEVYELAKRRGMDFVTITDHDTIAGALTLAHLPDTFISEELTVWFRGEPQAVHVLCYGITPDDHEWLQSHAGDIEACADYLHSNEITAALAHPFYAVEVPLTARHRRRLAELFPIWETRNGSRAKELNLPAFVYIETHGGPRSAGRTTMPESTSGGPLRRPCKRPRPKSFSRWSAPARRRPTAVREAARSGHTRRWRSRSVPWVAPARPARRIRRPC